MKWKMKCSKSILCHKSARDEGALVDMCGRDEEL
jgi:hypothetical protein